jgi:ADP-ribose pyrophosphatase
MTESETLCNGQWLRLKRRGRWEYAERTNPGGAVMIIAVTPDERILFVEQPRPAIERHTIEMPAGLVGDEDARADEGFLETARRELVEETGWRAGSLHLLVEGPPSAGMSNEVMGFVLARELERVGKGGGDATESILVHEIPRPEALDWLLERHRAGASIDPKVFAGLYMLDHAERFD